MAEQHKIWIEHFEAAENIEDEFGTQKALEYLVGEKFTNFLEAAETDADFRAEIPAFVTKIKTLFEQWQLAAYLASAGETEPFDPSLFEGDDEFDAEEVEDMRRDGIRQCTRDLLMVESAIEWLLDDLANPTPSSLNYNQPQPPWKLAAESVLTRLRELS